MDQEKTILIAEDEETLFNALAIKLKASGFKVAMARDGEECLAKALQEHPDLILLDIVMPKMDGMTALTKLREDKWGKSVPVIILTNLSNAEDAEKATKKGVFDYLVKANWKLEEVVEKVKKTLGA